MIYLNSYILFLFYFILSIFLDLIFLSLLFFVFFISQTMKKHVTYLLLSLLPPSYMVTPIRELANTLFPSTAIYLLSTSIAQSSSNMDMDIDIDVLRGRSASFSINSSRESSMHSNALFVPYHKRMEIQSNNLL